MYALERWLGHRWTRCAVCGNRTLLDRVRTGQPQPKDWRVVAMHGVPMEKSQALMKSA